MCTKGFLFFGLLLYLLTYATAQGGMLVDSSWLMEHLKEKDVRIVDVSRNPASFEMRHIPGARKVYRHRDLEDFTNYPPVGYPQREQFLDLVRRLGISNETTVVAYDDNKGMYASRLVFLLQLYRHPLSRLKILDGGIKEWMDEGLPVEKGPVQDRRKKEAKPYTLQPRKESLLARWQDIYRKVVQERAKDVVLLDVRPESEYEGDVVRLVRGGHIPGAVNLEVARFSVAQGSQVWKSSQELEAIFRKHGITKDKAIIIYCHSGDRSAHAFVILKDLLYYPDVRVYERQWEEWAVLQALRVDD